MTVYVESNFVLEIALGQHEAAAAESILAGAKLGKINLAVPVFALLEPFSTVTQRGNRRRNLTNRLDEELRDLRRLLPHGDDVRELERLGTVFDAIKDRETLRLVSTVKQMYEVAKIIDIDGIVYEKAMNQASTYQLSMNDAIILSAIHKHLQDTGVPGPHYFATRDAADLLDPAIAEELDRLGCRIVPTFRQCVQRLQLDVPTGRDSN